jgi:hypothetical protein
VEGSGGEARRLHRPLASVLHMDPADGSPGVKMGVDLDPKMSSMARSHHRGPLARGRLANAAMLRVRVIQPLTTCCRATSTATADGEDEASSEMELFWMGRALGSRVVEEADQSKTTLTHPHDSRNHACPSTRGHTSSAAVPRSL